MNVTYDAVSLRIMWDRLVSVADEIVSTLVRTSFSIAVREGGDLSCILFNGEGRCIAQGSYSLPSFTGTAPQTLARMLAEHPPETLQPGDVLVTNDPWIGTGHLFDINVARPVFRDGRIVGYTFSITHLPDIGGAGMNSALTEVYQEGLRLPVTKLMRGGTIDPYVINLIRTNVRVPDQVIGDLMANIACNEVGGRALLDLMDEYDIDDLGTISELINGQAEQAMRARFAAIPDGRYSNTIQIEGTTGPITLSATVEVDGDNVSVDYAGTDPSVPAGVNVPLCYTRAMTYYVLKSLTIPTLPNNDGATRPVSISAPAGCILNALPPSATGGRHSVGHFIVPLLMGALAKAVPDRVQADVAMMNVFNVQGRRPDGADISTLYFVSGGLGALDGMDGRSTTPAPSNMGAVPAEIWEDLTGMTVISRRILPDSGGPGYFRGGCGQELVLRNDTGHPLVVTLMGQRTRFPARGFLGGGDGQLREFRVNGKQVDGKGRHVLEPGDILTTIEAGGGGFGDPRQRSRDRVLADVDDGYVSAEAAARDYGVTRAAAAAS